MANPEGFWSYVHKDDQADSGRIVQLAHDVTAQYEVITGETISLFLDRDSLDWGDNWRENIDRSLGSAAFFVAILTPRYFMSSECRRELQTFAREAERIGVKDLILPLLYVDVPGLDDETNHDEAQRLIRNFQRIDWRQLRFAEAASGAYRVAVASLAQRLAKANNDINHKPPRKVLAGSTGIDASASSKGASFADLHTAITSALRGSVETVGEFAEEIGTFTGSMGKGIGTITPSMADSERAAILERLAFELAPSVDRITEVANKYSAKMYHADAAVRPFVLRAPGEIQHDAGCRPQVCDVYASITNLAQSSGSSTATLNRVIEFFDQDALPRQFRPLGKGMKLSASIMIEATSLIDEWAKAIKDSPVDCHNLESLKIA
jgi:hypothetical protein